MADIRRGTKVRWAFKDSDKWYDYRWIPVRLKELPPKPEQCEGTVVDVRPEGVLVKPYWSSYSCLLQADRLIVET